MNTARTLAIAAFAVASLPLLAQQPGSADQQPTTAAPASPAQTQTQQQQMTPQSSPAATATASAQLSPVDGELVDKLDTKTAKTGDAVVIKTKSDVKTADGTEIPKGSKLVGKVVGVKPLGEGNQNSQVALHFDHVELKGGQNVPVHAELQSLSTSESGTSGSAEAMAPTPGGGSPSASASAPSGTTNGPSSATATPTTSQPQATSGAAAGGPAPGTIVARTGNIAIKTTSIPGVLLATNEPGQQDPRMAQSSGILLGPKHDVHLESGTKVVVGVAGSNGAAPGGSN